MCAKLCCALGKNEVPCSPLAPVVRRACGPAKTRPMGEASLSLRDLGTWRVTKPASPPPVPCEQNAICDCLTTPVPHQTSLEPSGGSGEASQKYRFQKKKKKRTLKCYCEGSLEMILFSPQELMDTGISSRGDCGPVDNCWWGFASCPVFKGKSE